MSFTNSQVELETLPRFDSVEFRRLDARYPAIVLALVGGFELLALLVAGAVVVVIPELRAALTTLPLALVPFGAFALAALLAWYAHKAASVIRYAVREHDVIVHSGVFFKRDVIQPIRRIQHVEQTQGPVARRFGLAKIRLFSAGTAQYAFEIPGLEAETAARMRESILSLRESKLAASAQPPNVEAPESRSEAGGSTAPTVRPADG